MAHKRPHPHPAAMAKRKQQPLPPGEKVRNWYDPAPVDSPYPWKNLTLPWIPREVEALRAAQEMKERGNDSFKKGDYYDALWKYEHSLTLLDSFEKSSVVELMAVVHSNVAACCLKLGDEGRIDLLHCSEGFPIHPIMWYGFSHQHSHQAVLLDPGPKIAHKAYKRRGDSYKKMMRYPGMDHAMKAFLPPNSNPYLNVICDYVDSCKNQETPDPKTFYEAITMAVNEDQTKLIPPLSDYHIQSGFTSKLLKEVFSDPDSTLEHVEYILFDLVMESTITPRFNADGLSPVPLLKKDIFGVRLYKKLIDFGLPIKGEDIDAAVKLIPTNRLGLFKYLVSKCPDTEVESVLKSACDSAAELKKNQFLDVLKECCKNLYTKLKDEGNALFANDDYEEALSKYFQALRYCREHNMKKEMSLIRANCAQTCLKLEMYNDAYTHCCECIKLDRTNDKGYYRRAQALKGMLRNSTENGSYMDVVKDYLKCCELHPRPLVDAFAHAVVLAVRHDCTQLVPKLRSRDVRSGFSKEFFHHLVSKHPVTSPLLQFVCLKLLDSSISSQPYDASCMFLKNIIPKTSDGEVMKLLLKWGLRVKEDDLLTATQSLPDSQVDVYEAALKHSYYRHDPLNTCINLACSQAMQLHKKNFVMALIKQGSTPPPNQLAQVPGIFDEPFIQKYLKSIRAAMQDQEQQNRDDSEEDSDSSNKMSVRELNAEAKRYFKAGNTKNATKLYQQALRLCEDSELSDEAASIHSNLAHLHLDTGVPDAAFEHATSSIKFSQNNPKAYFRRAEAAKRMLKGGKSAPGLSYDLAIQDYRKSFQLKADLKTLAEGLTLACEHNKMSSMLPECKGLSQDSRQKVLQYIVTHHYCKPSLLDFLMLEAWEEGSVDCSNMPLKTLLTGKRANKFEVLKWFLDFGMAITESDISCAIQSLSNDDIDIFKLLVSKCAKFDSDKLCKEATSCQKTIFVLHFVELGAKLPEDSIKLFTNALKANDFDSLVVLVKSFTTEISQKLDLGVLLKTTNLVASPEVIKLLLEKNVGFGGKPYPIVAVMNLTISIEEKIDTICVLIEGGMDCKQLCRTSPKATTPLHVATELALKSDGITKLIDTVLASPSFDKSSKLINDKGETPLHLAVKPHLKKSVSSTVLKCLLEAGIIDPSTKDKANKKARDYITSKGKEQNVRLKMLEDALAQFHPKKEDKKKRKGKSGSEKAKNSPDAEKPPQPLFSLPPEKKQPEPSVAAAVKKVVNYAELSLTDKIAFRLSLISKQNEAYFQQAPDCQPSPSSSLASVDSRTARKSPMKGIKGSQVASGSSASSSPRHRSSSRSCSGDRNARVVARLNLDGSPMSFGTGEFSLEGLNFDILPWEVEITRNVVKFFKNTKKHSPTDRVRAAEVMYSIAEGRRNLHLSKQVGSSKSVCLFEARITDSGRILWEKAITYSKKLTGDSSYPMYTEVIRVWEIILDHDDLDRRITYCSDQIVQSYERGFLSSVRRPLKPIAQSFIESGSEGVRQKEVLCMPCTYTIKDLTSFETDCHFVPAASTNESEYNVTTFYSFDTVHAKSMITGNNEKRDYPFKEWQREHEIIKINSKEAILLLGRSGTGKTTCCLYRLWNEFKNYWNPDSETFGFKIPRKTLVSSSSLDYSDDDEVWSDSDELSGEGSDGDMADSAFAESTEVDVVPGTNLKSEVWSSDPDTSAENNGEATKAVEMLEEDLHQVFVTKNYVLCDQMKKRFYCMMAAYDFMEPHLQFEEEALPNSFGKFDNLSFPAFLTARQFYMLLDNSLGGDDTFFKRDADGNLQVKISSLDYDHEDADILLDLEESDSEDEEVKLIYRPTASEQPTTKLHSAKWTEVTALYFKEIVWPKISHTSIKEFDPMLVWLEIQSFIKGSELAIRKGSPLSLEQYMSVGNRMAPNFSGHRETIYKLFLRYKRFVQNCRHTNYLFDECDLVLDLHNRLKTTSDVSWSIHSVYIDEVQDFTQAELAIFIHCCRDPNSMFFTGDTAQSIMRGIAFRFQDLRSCFHRIHSKVPYINVPKEPLKLTINYRSHAGILKLAGSVIDLISEFFKDSIDHLPDDEGMFPGPMPVFLDSCEEKDLSLLLSTNKRECSAIEFGAHQVILVQSKEAKDRLPDILKGAIVLTIFESKGLEFDDVLLYNFFTDSLVSEKDWRVVTSYLEMPNHSKKIENMESLPGHSSEPRSKLFNPTLHKSLNAELKYLYTAITRAKCNLWIYDSNKKNRLPMLHYWHRRNTVKVVTDSGGGKDFSLVFASNSTPEQWSAQGDNFRKKHLWEQAILCYEKAGMEYAYLVKEAYAYHYIQEARQQKPQLFLKAALSFLERDELEHSVHCLNGAALCLKMCRPPRYVQAAKLFEKLGDLAKASQCFLKGRDFENFSRIQESLGDYNSVIRSLQGKPFMKKREALAKADEYEKKGYVLDPIFTPSELSFSCAKFYADRKDTKMLLEVLKFMPEQERRVKFLKEVFLFKEAFDDCCANGQYTSAYRLASAHGFFDEAIALARKVKDEVTEAKFVLQRAKFTFINLPHDFKEADVDSVIIAKLKAISSMKDKKSLSPELQLLLAEANLLLGMLLKKQGPCITALGQFKVLKHKAGILEAFDQVGKHGKVSDQDILDCSHVAKKAAEVLKAEGSDMKLDVKQAMKFCGFQLIGKVYLTSAYGNIWISDDILKGLQDDLACDIDGMIRLKSEVKQVLANRYRGFVIKWPQKLSNLQNGLHNFKLHEQIYTQRSLSRQYSPKEVSSLSMREYLQVFVHYLELQLLKDDTSDSKIDSLIAHLLIIFSPQVYIYLPQCLNDQHLRTVRRSENSRKRFETWIETQVQNSSKDQDNKALRINEWLFVWRASCIAVPSMKLLLEKINNLELEVGKNAAAASKDHKFVPPPGYIYWNSEKRYYHIFSFWLNSCVDIREKSRALWAAKLAITHFLGNIAEDKQVSISVMNGVDILSIHCTSLLAMITQSNIIRKYPATFVVPLMYKHMVQLFSHMNCRSGTPSDKSLLAACVEQVSSYRNLGLLFSECRQLLVRAMGYLIGTYPRAPWFSLLKFGLYRFPQSDATRLCLILTFTLLGNLAMLKVKDLRMLESKLVYILKKATSKNEHLPEYISKICDLVSQSPEPSFPPFAFNIVTHLLVDAKMDCTMSRLVFKQKLDGRGGHIEFVAHQEPKQSKDAHSSKPAPPVTSARSSSNNLPASIPPSNLPVSSSSFTPSGNFPSSSRLVSSKLPDPHVPTSSDLGTPLPVSPPTAPIGSERRLAGSGGGSNSSTPSLTSSGQIPQGTVPVSSSTLNPLAASYLPPSAAKFPPQGGDFEGMPYRGDSNYGLVGQPSSTLPPIGQPPSTLPPIGQPLQRPVSQDPQPPVGHLSKPPQHSVSLPADTVGHSLERSVGHHSELALDSSPLQFPLGYQHPQDVPFGHNPEHALGHNIYSPEESAFGFAAFPSVSAPSILSEFTMGGGGSYQPFNFQDDSFDYSNMPDFGGQDDLAAGVIPDEVFEMSLTQAIGPVLQTDPAMVGEDIIDDANNFCNVCGITYHNDTAEVFDYQEQSNMEGFHAHVTGPVHHDNTVAYKRFIVTSGELGTDGIHLIEMARTKLDECKKLKQAIVTEQLDQIIDDLQDQIYNYDREISDFKDSRQWREGIQAVTDMNARVDRLLKSANDLLVKVGAEFEAKKQEMQRRERYVDEDDGFDQTEIDELSAQFDKTVDAHTKGKSIEPRKGEQPAIRSMQEKVQSRERKRSKRNVS